ncbi:MAG TPA: HAMP domain-containing sensor histidine kinase [Thermotogota bacterium]|nr:HAMP domain-containing sensor histidine kinase [Thermotogota bacterium]HPJ88461.1 HAMP domain-containing sensor histidine kinase [Thermotogota bacterium]HPR96500.1 HAMP domain-containing sensor histidine kinase [Thermotogota bacterium]
MSLIKLKRKEKETEQKDEFSQEYPKALKKARLNWSFLFTIAIFCVVLFFSLIIIRFQESTLFNRIDNRLIEMTNLSQTAVDRFRIPEDEGDIPQFFFEKGQFIQVYDTNGNLKMALGEQIPENMNLKIETEMKPDPEHDKKFHTIRFSDDEGNIRSFRTYTIVIKNRFPAFSNITVRVGLDIQKAIDEKDAFRNGVILFTAIFPLFAWILGYILAGIVLKPVRENYNLLRRFSFDASHELKTPLAIIKMSTGMLMAKTDKMDETVVKKVQTIDKATERMDNLVRQLLQLARAQNIVDNDKVNEKIDLQQFMISLVEEYTSYADKHRVSIRHKVFTNREIKTNRNALRSILGNILDNAIKFSPEGSFVDIRIKKGVYSMSVEIEDKGPGIAEEDRKKIFDRFFKADKSRHDSRGSGMGLSIADEYAKRLGIKIEVESEPGSGTTFIVKIPV